MAADPSAPRAPVPAIDPNSLPAVTLKKIVVRENDILDDATRQGDNVDEESLRQQLQEIAHEYELLLHDAPNFPEAYAAYGQLLWRLDMRKESVAMMLKANQLDPNIPFVKNKIGNYLAEEGKPLEAVNYFISALKLAPQEPLYHYNFGLLLYEARDDFLKSGDWTRDQIDRAMHEAFKRAAELAPDKLEYLYAYADSFYALEHPDWAQALKAWEKLEAKGKTPEDRQGVRLQEANVLLKQGKTGDARAVLDTITAPGLQTQKEKLVALAAETAKK